MNTNLLHNILNVVGLIIGVLITLDWQTFGLDPVTAAQVAGGVLVADKIVKLAINITRDGLVGLVKSQPPVEH